MRVERDRRVLYCRRDLRRAKSNFIEGTLGMRRGASSGLLAGSDDLAELGHLFLLVGVGKLVEDLVAGLGLGVSEVLEALAPDAAGEIQVLLHHGDPRRVNGAEVSVLKETSQVALGRLLQGQERLRLEAKLTVDAVAD